MKTRKQARHKKLFSKKGKQQQQQENKITGNPRLLAKCHLKNTVATFVCLSE